MRQTFEIPLDIPDVTIEHVTTNCIGHIEITVKSTLEGTPCRQCGKLTTKFYGEDRQITLEFIPIKPSAAKDSDAPGSWVAYFLVADKYFSSLASRLSDVNQPVIRSQIRFSASR
ncbi:MAG: hypothetical protein OEU26_13370 [Candidatus Tectomicrobia bacterium]|nr:hypothetical protein [Candidatus Tectomicrobia bacterium]